jgi:hypothetical protein
MGSILRVAVLAVVVLAIRCTSGGGPTSWVSDLDQAKWDDLEAAADTVRLGAAFDLRVGETVFVARERLWVVFADVPLDSRCPENDFMLCFWEGVAFVHLWVRQDAPNGTPSEPVELVVHTTDTGPYSKLVEHGAYTITLGGLVPYPTYTPDSIPGPQPEEFHVPKLSEYIVTLTVAKTGSPNAD